VKLAVQRASRAAHIPADASLRRWAGAAGVEGAVTVRYVGEAEGRRLNREFRGKDHATNVLTFDYQREPVVVADLVLCAPVVAREAKEQRKTLAAHYAHLLVHGTLHAQGHDHEEDHEARVMESLESEAMTGLGFADPYRRRAIRRKAKA